MLIVHVCWCAYVPACVCVRFVFQNVFKGAGGEFPQNTVKGQQQGNPRLSTFMLTDTKAPAKPSIVTFIR